MADRRDDLDAWLGERIEPLPPPPGTFDLIKRRARRRKFRKLAITATAAAAVVAAAVTVPQVVSLPVVSPNPTTSVAAGQSNAATPTRSSPAAVPSTAVSSAARTAPVPPDFQPTSVTFVGEQTGWVIGQAGTPGHCATQYCTSLARTDNAGQSWTGVPAPLAGQPDGATGVGQVRFLNLADGWAFGPELFATHDGGRTWTKIGTHGLRVTGLETVGSRVFALWASCTGNGRAFASFCSTFTLYSSPAGSDDWAPAGAATTGLTSGGYGAASLALTGSRGYLLAPDGTLYAGPVDGTAAWTRAGSLTSSCSAGTALPSGQPSGALLGAANASDLIVACTSPGNGDVEAKQIFSSPNGGVSWLQMGTAPAAGTAFSLAASPQESVVLATDKGIELLPKGEIAWRMATLKAAVPGGGFSFVGMTTEEQGVALPSDPSSGTVWFTFDGGQTWQPSRLNGS